ncbi:hypothetical protein, partial [Nostoc sp.]|uniref:hypothetical protein n=1 Tax=Nostoc sp. TaxID=1180 RepID=UPI003594832B
ESISVQASDNSEKLKPPIQEVKPIVEAQTAVIEPSGDVNLLAEPNKDIAVASSSPDGSCFAQDSVSKFLPETRVIYENH